MFLFAAMYLMGVKLCYFHQISLFRVVVVVVVVVGGDSLDCKIWRCVSDSVGEYLLAKTAFSELLKDKSIFSKLHNKGETAEKCW